MAHSSYRVAVFIILLSVKYVRLQEADDLIAENAAVVCLLDNEEYSLCGTSCPLTCDRLTPVLCDKKCNVGCFCKPGFVRNANGQCVKPENCPRVSLVEAVDSNVEIPSEVCLRENEEYSLCGSSCPPTCGIPPTTRCDRKCNFGCFCKAGFVRNTANGECVKPEDCTRVAARATCVLSNEEYQTCGTACPLTCRNFARPPTCTWACVEGCFCKRGFVRNDDGECVLTEDCPQTPLPRTTCLLPNEEFQECVPQCQLTCINYSNPPMCPWRCGTGCFCKKGYVRSQDGQCVLPIDCPQIEPPEVDVCVLPNEEFKDCGTACPLTCDNYISPPVFCTDNCVVGCFCKEGFVRSATGHCIPPEYCPREPPQICPKPNEEFTTCGTSCPRNCSNYWKNDGCDLLCNVGCFCKPGYVRDEEGNCISPENCPLISRSVGRLTCKRPNEEFTQCGSRCPQYCSNYGVPMPCNHRCIMGCVCKNGFIRDDITGDCILPEDCRVEPTPFPPRRCKAGEEWQDCGTMCPITCDNFKHPPVFCPLMCVAGCFCQAGLVRAKNGWCIPPSNCPGVPPPIVCKKPNEEYHQCGTACPDTCDNYEDIKRPCRGQCGEGCFCKRGFVRDAAGNCIDPEECPAIPVPTAPAVCSRPNEVFRPCKSMCPDTCENYGTIRPCILPCFPGCDCKPGYVRDSQGNCILPEKCEDAIPVPTAPAVCSRPNEVFRPCKSMCPDTCENYGTIRSCILPCFPGCDCEPGYVRDNQGNCILPEECENAIPPTAPTICSRPNEVFRSCKSMCPDTCENYGTIRPCILPCFPGCDCEPGYVRDSQGNCILPEECKDVIPPTAPTICSRPNEVFRPCKSMCPDTCDNYGTIRPCILPCFPGCDCEPGYVRDRQSNCILPEECEVIRHIGPKVCYKEHEKYLKCGTACPATCDNYRNPPQACTANCVEGCFCRTGYIRDAVGNCIKPKKCPVNKKCGYREVYQRCGTACPDTCKNYWIHSRRCTKNCVAGCFCRKGYVRDDRNKCIRPQNCPRRP